jgi:DNA-directed RNA polymerase specialized sigma24 family protein
MISSRSSCGKRYPDQAALIAGVKSGEQEAVGCLYRHLYEKAFPSVRKLVKAQQGSEADAEDLFQEAFLKFRRKIIEGSYVYQPSAAVATYYYELYRYAWRDELKSARRRTYGGGSHPRGPWRSRGQC